MKLNVDFSALHAAAARMYLRDYPVSHRLADDLVNDWLIALDRIKNDEDIVDELAGYQIMSAVTQEDYCNLFEDFDDFDLEGEHLG